MRLTGIVLVAASVLLSSLDAVSTGALVQTGTTNSVQAPRFLRSTTATKEEDSEDDNYSADEERAPLIDPVVGKIPSTVNRLTTADGKKLSKTLDYAIKNWQLRSQVSKTFRDIESKGWTPAKVADKFNIKWKVENLSPKMLDHDEGYHFWRQFIKYWGKAHPVKNPVKVKVD